MKKEQIFLSYEQWVAVYKPRLDPNGTIEIIKDKDYIEEEKKNRPYGIWTLMDCNILVSEYHVLDIKGYVITNIPYYHNELIEVEFKNETRL